MEWATVKRTGKIFIDYNMNVRGKTLNVAFSPRGVADAPVSMPLSWEELEAAEPGDFTIGNVMQRLDRTGDRWHDVVAQNKALPALSASVGSKSPARLEARQHYMAAPRSIGSLTISFGLVAIPVKLYTATQSTGQISFNLLHKDCGSRLKQQYICLKDGTGRRARRHRQGLRVREGPVRRVHARGDQGARRGRLARGRDLGVRADRVDRSRCTSTRRITSPRTRAHRNRMRC